MPDATVDSVDDAVSCIRCEAVCCRMLVVVLPDDNVPNWLTTHDERGLQVLARNDEGWCAAVDPVTFRCTIYDERPAICRKYTMGGPSCQEERQKWAARAAVPTRVNTLG